MKSKNDSYIKEQKELRKKLMNLIAELDKKEQLTLQKSFKQETLEEAANRLFYTVGNEGISSIDSFMKGAKWQAKRGYSEEEVLEFANWCRIQDNKYPNRVITIQQLLEQFKKK